MVMMCPVLCSQRARQGLVEGHHSRPCPALPVHSQACRRVALQLFASWNITKDEAIKLAEGQIAQSWCGKLLDICHSF